MGDLLTRLHRAHVERQQRFFPIEAVRFSEKPPMIVPQTEKQTAAPIFQPIISVLPPPTFISIKAIIRHVAHYYRVDPLDIVSARRTNYIVIPRHVAMYIAKTLTPHSLPEIGRRFGGRDHT